MHRREAARNEGEAACSTRQSVCATQEEEKLFIFDEADAFIFSDLAQLDKVVGNVPCICLTAIIRAAVGESAALAQEMQRRHDARNLCQRRWAAAAVTVSID